MALGLWGLMNTLVRLLHMAKVHSFFHYTKGVLGFLFGTMYRKEIKEAPLESKTIKIVPPPCP